MKTLSFKGGLEGVMSVAAEKLNSKAATGVQKVVNDQRGCTVLGYAATLVATLAISAATYLGVSTVAYRLSGESDAASIAAGGGAALATGVWLIYLTASTSTFNDFRKYLRAKSGEHEKWGF